MNRALQPKRIDQLRSVPLESILCVCGARRDRSDRRKWHTAQGVLSIQSAKFINWNRGQGGGGAIDLVIHLHGLTFPDALLWLDTRFPQPPEPLEISTGPGVDGLKLPPRDNRRLDRVRNYLTHQRALPRGRIDLLVESGALYADSRANAVFLMWGPDHQPVGAELRGTTSRPWWGMAPGSRKDLGFFFVAATSGPPARALILCESAIDAISCSSIYPDHRSVSTAGARPNPAWLAPLLQTHRVHCGFDADATGDSMARAMIARHPQVIRLRPERHDWNVVLRSSS